MLTINFQSKTTGDYVEVEKSIFSPIAQHLKNKANVKYDYLPDINSLNMAMFFGRGGDIFMSHGVADKNYMLKRGAGGQCALNDFAAVFVPGPWMKEKLLADPAITLDREQIIPVGWPRLDDLIEKSRSYKRKPSDKLRVLWAPTHDARKHGTNGKSTSSFPDFMQFTESLGDHIELGIALHPRNRTDKTPTSLGMIDADIVISDFGTMVYEAWALGKPVIFPYWLVGEGVQKYRPSSAEAHIFKHRIGYHPESFEELKDLLSGKLKITSDVTKFMNEYLPPDTLGNSGKICSDHLLNIAENIKTFRNRASFKFMHGTRAASIELVDTLRQRDKEQAKINKEILAKLEKLTNENAENSKIAQTLRKKLNRATKEIISLQEIINKKPQP